MFIRAATAGRAWSKLFPESRAAIIALPRTKCRSGWPLNEKVAAAQELFTVLNVLPANTRVELLSVGSHGLTTHLESFAWLSTAYHDLDICVILVVPLVFPASDEVFPTAANGVRYGVFRLADIVATMEAMKSGQGHADKKCRILLKILSIVRLFKTG